MRKNQLTLNVKKYQNKNRRISNECGKHLQAFLTRRELLYNRGDKARWITNQGSYSSNKINDLKISPKKRYAELCNQKKKSYISDHNL